MFCFLFALSLPVLFLIPAVCNRASFLLSFLVLSCFFLPCFLFHPSFPFFLTSSLSHKPYLFSPLLSSPSHLPFTPTKSI
ncbi:hypothetical protein BKA57DRAFT_176845 [Linnemannia elongata]|nr:hypothetical protein BKA57DRAFT_176845 [Linnemannia elongata]